MKNSHRCVLLNPIFNVVYYKFGVSDDKKSFDQMCAFASEQGDVAENETAFNVIIGIASAIGAVVAGIAAFKKITSAVPAVIAALSNPVVWIIAAIVVVIIEVITYWDTLKEIFSEGIQWWKDLFSKWWNTIVTYIFLNSLS